MRTIYLKLGLLLVVTALFSLNLSLSVVKGEGEVTLGQLNSNAQTVTEVGSNCLEVRTLNSTYIQYSQTQCCQTERVIYTTYDVNQVGAGCPRAGESGKATDMTISYSGVNCCG
jgi:hypothetical protein